MQRYNALGLKAFISEWDVGVPLVSQGNIPAVAPQDGASSPYYWPAQAKVYSDVMDACLESPNCIGATTWGMNPINNNWDGEAGFGLTYRYSGDANLFDLNNKPKPAYTALLNSFARAQTRRQFIVATSIVYVNGAWMQPSARFSQYIGAKDAQGVTAYPQVILLIDGVPSGSFYTNSDAWVDYNLTANLTAGTHTIGLSLPNISNIGPTFLDQRNIAVQSVTFTPQ